MSPCERNDLLRFTIKLLEEPKMKTKNKPQQKIDISNMPKNERIQLLKEVRERLKERIVEEKLWRSLIKAEMVTINGNMIFSEQDPLKGLCFGNEMNMR